MRNRLFPSCLAALLLCSTALSTQGAEPASTLGPAEHQGSQKLIEASADGSVVLPASDASVHGTNIRYEPQPHKNTIGYWSKAEDWVSWSFQLAKPGTFAIEVLQGCGKGQGGSEVEISVGEQTLPMVVEDTGHFQNFVPRTIGKVTIPAGRHTLAIRAKMKKAGAVMDVRQVKLTPAAE